MCFSPLFYKLSLLTLEPHISHHFFHSLLRTDKDVTLLKHILDKVTAKDMKFYEYAKKLANKQLIKEHDAISILAASAHMRPGVSTVPYHESKTTNKNPWSHHSASTPNTSPQTTNQNQNPWSHHSGSHSKRRRRHLRSKDDKLQLKSLSTEGPFCSSFLK